MRARCSIEPLGLRYSRRRTVLIAMPLPSAKEVCESRRRARETSRPSLAMARATGPGRGDRSINTLIRVFMCHKHL